MRRSGLLPWKTLKLGFPVFLVSSLRVLPVEALFGAGFLFRFLSEWTRASRISDLPAKLVTRGGGPRSHAVTPTKLSRMACLKRRLSAHLQDAVGTLPELLLLPLLPGSSCGCAQARTCAKLQKPVLCVWSIPWVSILRGPFLHNSHTQQRPARAREEFVYPYASPLDELRAADKARKGGWERWEGCYLDGLTITTK